MANGTDWPRTRREIFERLRDRPLDYANDEDRALYQPVHDAQHDPVRRLFQTIQDATTQTVQLVAGFRGSGKTTEFSRLEDTLWREGYLVIRVDLDDFVDMHSPVDVRDFLLVLAGAVSERLRDARLLGPVDGAAASFWARAKGFLGRVHLDEVSVKTPSWKVLPEVEWKLAIKEDTSFREQLRAAIGAKLPRLVREVHEYHRDVLRLLRAKHGADKRLVVIFDSLEHIRGVDEKVAALHNSVRDLFLTNGRHLELPDTHTIYSVPAFMALYADNVAAEFVTGTVQAWTAFHVRHMAVDAATGARTLTDDEVTIARLVALVEKRIDWSLLLADRDALKALILASGGYIRDLLNMLIEALHLTDPAAGRADPARIVARMRRNYTLFAEEVAVLRRVAEDHDVRSVAVAERERLARFLDSHLVLCYVNDTFWYDVHPLIRPAVTAP